MADVDLDLPAVDPSSDGVRRSTLILIGMPGVGKTTLGRRLAESTGRRFIDTDEVIEAREKLSLQALLDAKGLQALLAAEQAALLTLQDSHAVIATGGSVVYSAPGMNHLHALGRIVFLSLDLPTLSQRLHNASARGIARREGQSLASLFAERDSLYRRYADTLVDCRGKSEQQLLQELLALGR